MRARTGHSRTSKQPKPVRYSPAARRLLLLPCVPASNEGRLKRGRNTRKQSLNESKRAHMQNLEYQSGLTSKSTGGKSPRHIVLAIGPPTFTKLIGDPAQA